MMANEKRLVDAKHLSERIRKKDGIVAMTERAGKLFNSCYPILMHFLEEEPTVDAVEVVHGRWIEDRWTKWQCDKCHSPSPAYGYPRREYVKTRYCPNCGAKMDGDGNG